MRVRTMRFDSGQSVRFSANAIEGVEHQEMQRVDSDTASGPPPYPRGWFAVAFSDELARGDVKPLTRFGRELVLWRDASGAVGVADAYCPHLGAHLGHGGRVEGDALVCPFHAWKFGRDGACSAMPYGRRIPSNARLEPYPVREQDDVILVFNDPARDGTAPEWEMPRFDLTPWSQARRAVRVFRGHPQEVAENSADAGHFEFIHKTGPAKIGRTPTTEGPFYSSLIVSDLDRGGPGEGMPAIHSEVASHGPGLSLNDIDAGLKSFTRVYHTPIDGEQIEVRLMSYIQAPGDPDEVERLADIVAEQTFSQVDDDIVIWENKRYRSAPALNETEGPVAEFRRWYGQFYA